MTAKTKSRDPLDATVSPMALAVLVPIFWALVLLTAAWVLHAAQVPAYWVPGVAFVAALVFTLVAVGVESPRDVCWFVALLVLTAGGYLTWTTYTTPWQQWAILGLVPAMVVFGGWWRFIQATNRLVRTDEEKAELDHAKAIARQDMPAILSGAGFKGVTGKDPVPFPAGSDNPAGSDQVLTLPPNGTVTLRLLQAQVDKIEIAARAQHPIRFRGGRHAAEVVVRRMFRDVLADDVPYPIDRAPKTIHQPVPLGVDEAGEEAGVILREVSGKIIGERGTGKSGTINTHLAYLTGCTDAIVWLIDGKGGRTGRPWAEALDWLACPTASDGREADAVFVAANAVIQSRSTGDGEKVHPHPGQPAVQVIVEESSVVTGAIGNGKRTKWAQDGVVLGRSEAVDFHFVGQRGTVTMLGTGDMASQLQYTVGLGISDMQDAVRAFGDRALSVEALRYGGDDRYKGVLLVKHPAWKSPMPIKGYWLEPSLIPGVAKTNARFKPQLEAAAVAAVEAALRAAELPAYADRWARFHGTTTGDTVPAQRPQTTAERLGLPESPIVAQILKDRDTGRDTSGDTTGDKAGDTGRDTAGDQAGDMSPDRGGDMSPDAELAMLRDMWDAPAAEGGHVPYDEAEQVVPTILAVVHNLFGARGVTRLHTQAILDELPGEMTPRRFGLLMAHCGVAKVPNAFEVDGVTARGYDVADVDRAISSARGGMKLNPAAFDWPDPAE
ncbi:MAG: hypothetical protein LC792_00420 [Actinobacteria bacterium]|nr:hypothetical protein [Actinomycetota bacterium]